MGPARETTAERCWRVEEGGWIGRFVDPCIGEERGMRTGAGGQGSATEIRRPGSLDTRRIAGGVTSRVTPLGLTRRTRSGYNCTHYGCIRCLGRCGERAVREDAAGGLGAALWPAGRGVLPPPGNPRGPGGAGGGPARAAAVGGCRHPHPRGRGRAIHYRANRACPIFAELQGLVRKTVGLADVLRGR